MPVDGLFLLGTKLGRAWLSNPLEQNVGARARFSAGIRVSSPQAQKQMNLVKVQVGSSVDIDR